jgi:hypothetical protein
MNGSWVVGALVVHWIAWGNPAWATDADIQIRPVRFSNGASTATIKGELKGRQTIDYILQAKAGQTLTVALSASHSGAYFNVLPPGSTSEALFIGSTQGNAWIGALPSDGEYRIRTYLYRNAARRNESASFTLRLGVGDYSTGTALRGDATAGKRGE